MKTIEEIREGLMEQAEDLISEAKKEHNSFMAKDMNGQAIGLLIAANQLKNIKRNAYEENNIEITISKDIPPNIVIINGKPYGRIE